MKELIAVTLLIGISFYSVVLIPPSISLSTTMADTVTNETPLLAPDIPLEVKSEVTEQNTPIVETLPPPKEEKTVSEPVVPTIPAPAVFGLKDCRQTQSEDSHQTEKGGHSYALDIACVRGVSYDVPAPHFKDFYVIEKVSFGDKLGNYLILKHGDERYVYGHTQTSRKEGERVKAGDIIGQSNNSGHSLGVHTHFEYWKNYINQTTIWDTRNNPYSRNLCTQRGWKFCEVYKDMPVAKKNTLETYYFTHYDLGDISQNDSAPCHGASGADLCFLARQGVNTMALTSDIRKKLGVKWWDKVILEGDEGCKWIYEVHDEMNPRYRVPDGWVKRPWTNYYIKGDLPWKPGGACTVQKINY